MIVENNAGALGTDTFEISWHSGARPSHQVWQGKVYRWKRGSSFVDVQPTAPKPPPMV